MPRELLLKRLTTRGLEVLKHFQLILLIGGEGYHSFSPVLTPCIFDHHVAMCLSVAVEGASLARMRNRVIIRQGGTGHPSVSK